MNEDALARLKQAILGYDGDEAESLARAVVAAGIDPLRGIDAMTEAIREVGDGFERGDLWLPDLIGAAAAMKQGTPVLEAAIREAGLARKSLGRVVIGTVFGDIHDIGKSMVSTLLTANGFSVEDVGVNVTADELVAAVDRHRPDLLALSALMTMTSLEQSKVIAGLERRGLRRDVKVIVGGGAITQSFADEIGADGYDASAPGAVKLARRLLGIEPREVAGECP